MKPFRTALQVRVVAGLLALAPALPLQAALVASESFLYAQTNRLTSLNGGLGWRTPWSGPGSIVLGSPAPDRTAAAGNSFLTQGSGGAAFRTPGTNGWDHLLTAQRKFGRDGSTLWLSFVLRRDTRPAGNRYLGLSLFDDGAERLFVGAPFNADVWGIEVSSVGSAARSSVAISNGVPSLLVVRMLFGVQGTQDSFALFVNPIPGVSPDVPDAQTAGNLSFNRIRLTGGEGAVTGVFDEIRMGENFEDVVPPPSLPASAARVPMGWVIPRESIDTNAVGFGIRVAQASQLAGVLPPSVARAEAQLAGTLLDPENGQPYANEAQPGSEPDGSHVELETVNFNQAPGGSAGSFGPDRLIPGLSENGGNTDNLAMEVIAIVELPVGHHRWGIHSDDGFRLTLGVGDNPRDRTARTVGVVDGGLAGQDTIFDFLIEKAGFYAVRLVWFESSGGAHVEWFTVDTDTGERVLVNDRSNVRALRAYRALSTISRAPYVSRIEPLPDSTAVPPDSPLEVEWIDGDTQVDASSVRLFLNGAPVAAEARRSGALTTLLYRPATLFAAGSRQRALVTFADNGSPAVTREAAWEFQIEDYPTLPGVLALPWGSEDPSRPGFRVRTVQSSVPVGPTRLERAEAQLASRIFDPNTGEAYPNVADLQGADAEGFFSVETTLNFNQDGSSGQDGHFKPDRLVPGIPGTTGTTQNFAVEILTYLELAEGLHRFGINSDDGFRLTVGRDDPRDAFGVELGVYPADRGAGDSTFSFVAPVAGIYPMRLVWWQGTGGASLEWYAFDRASGERQLINDRSRPGALRAWQSVRQSSPFHVAQVEPRPGDTRAGGDARLTVAFSTSSGATPPSLDSQSVALMLDGHPVSHTSIADGGRRVFRQAAGPLLAPGSRHSAEARWQVPGESRLRSATWDFLVEDYPTLPPSHAKPRSRADTSAPGFSFRIVQGPPLTELPNTSLRAETQLAGTLVHPDTGELLTNEAQTGPGYGGIFELTGIINFNEDGPTVLPAGEGSFRPDLPMPGLPGKNGHSDNYVTETVAWLDLPAGYVRMGVNSDDGFRVTLAEGSESQPLVLGSFEGGRGPADSVFTFAVPMAGLYPFRLVHYEGNQGSSLEWFTVVDGADGRKVLVNDRTRPEALVAWRRLQAATSAALTVDRQSDGRLILRWPSGAGWRLESTADLASGTWVARNPDITDGTLAIEPQAERLFFRLVRP